MGQSKNKERAIVAYGQIGGVLLFAHGGCMEQELTDLGTEMHEYVADMKGAPESGLWVYECRPFWDSWPDDNGYDGCNYDREPSWRPLTVRELLLFQDNRRDELHALWNAEGIPDARDQMEQT